MSESAGSPVSTKQSCYQIYYYSERRFKADPERAKRAGITVRNLKVFFNERGVIS